MNHYTTAVVAAEKEITQLESERQRIDSRIQHLQDFIREGRLITSTNGTESTTKSTPSTTPAIPRTLTRRGSSSKKGTIMSGSVSDHVRRILTEAGTPVHVQDILKKLKRVRKVNKRNPWAEIWAVVRRHPDIFVRSKTGFYALRTQTGSR